MSQYVAVGSLTRPAPQFAAAEGAGVTLCRFDDKTGVLSVAADPLRLEDATWLVAAPGGGRFYAVTDTDGGHESALAVLGLDRDAAALRLIETRPAGGHDGCHAVVTRDGGQVLVANYGGPREDGPQAGLAVFGLRDGRLGAPDLHTHSGSGPNRARQEGPHAHCVALSPDERFAFVADLGTDRLVAYERTETGAHPRPDLDTALPPGTGPRHFVFSADGRRVYVVGELIAAVTSLSYAPETGRMEVLAAEPLAPAGGAPVQPAGIVLHPDGRHLLVSVRLSEEIVVLALDGPDATARTVSRHPAGGTTPRDLTVSPSGRHLLVANQDSSRVVVWPLTDARPGPEPTCVLPLGTPMRVAFA
ncbi:3-carboxymuconate cyclase-like [Oceanicola granulosus HTCC2516]|uniref:3-carboxymuconate cyclase-like n=1 Tax=Oceanicola granulosus (strain ATCC BAA-861 / DSM 15982 / KCTC 12143 / HTCC2516) TaxID=314256 RepID=Q2CHI3_OCEGH|nr:lactonase family protein [Oceanicola granulosus]EAR52056.1 3-carboxymuconate cyclase-like [Oceanicola granulosus HTCC2516]